MTSTPTAAATQTPAHAPGAHAPGAHAAHAHAHAPPDGAAAPPLETGLLRSHDAAVIEILDAAAGCFRKTGYAATTIREIARAAGVSHGLVHYHFQSKEHLFLEVQVRTYNRLADEIAASLDATAAPGTRALYAIDRLFHELRRNADLHAQARAWAASLEDARLLVHVRTVRDRLRAQLVALADRVLGPAAAELPMATDTAVDVLWAFVQGLGLQAAIDDDERVERAFDGMRQLIARLFTTHALLAATAAAAPAATRSTP